MSVLVGLIAVLVIARGRGWFGAIRRHPGATLAVEVVLLVVALPLGWVLGSPVFIRTEVQEDSSLAVVIASPGTVAASPVTVVASAGTVAESPVTLPSEPAAVSQPTVIAQGEFKGADDFHFGSGQALLVETSPGAYVLRLEGFSVRNGPDLFVYLSADPAGYTDGGLELVALKASDGSFNYEIPAGIDVATFHSAVIWCRAFSVQFAAAPLGPA